MKAIVFDHPGDFDKVLSLKEVPVPEPGENEVRIKVLASPINPADILFVNGKYRVKPLFPQIAGLEGAGIIDKLGTGANLPVGALVAFRHKKVWAEYVVVPVEKITLLPADFPIEKACQFSLNPVTAYALLDEGNLKNEDEWLLLTSGNSAVSKLIIQLAKMKNYKTIAVTRRSGDFAGLKALGATATILDDPANIENTISEITEGKGVKCILDAVGGDLISRLLKTISQYGKLVSYGLLSAENVTYHNSDIIFRNITIKGFGIDNWLSEISETRRKEVIGDLIQIMKNTDFKQPVAATFKFADFDKSFEKFKNTRDGKIILIP